MNLRENVERIRQMMGLLNEQEEGPWNPDYKKPTIYDFSNKVQKNYEKPKENLVSFSPITITGSYTAPLGNCDTLHAFNDNGTRTVGKMNDIVNPELMKVYHSGVNPDITDVSIDISKGNTEYTVNWSVTIDKSKNGIAYIGLYSRGGGAISKPGGYPDTISTTSGHASIEECKKSSYIKKRGTVDDMELVKNFEFNKDRKLSGCVVKQLFYKYTLKEYPSYESIN